MVYTFYGIGTQNEIQMVVVCLVLESCRHQYVDRERERVNHVCNQTAKIGDTLLPKNGDILS